MLPGPNLLRRTNRHGKVPFLCNSIVTSGAEYGPRTFVTVTRMRYEIVILSTCDSKPWRPHDAGRNLRDESLGRNGRLASAGQRRGANTGLIGAGRRQAWRRDRFPLARWVLDISGADLSRAAARFAAAKTHRRAYRIRQNRTRFTLRPRVRSAMPCGLTASGTNGHSRRATRRGFPNISRRGRRSRSSGFTMRCGVFMPPLPLRWWRRHR